MKIRVIFANNHEIYVEPGSSLENLMVVSHDKNIMVRVWDEMTENNLKTLTIKNDSDVLIGEYHNLLLVNETSEVRPDGSVLTSYHLREKTKVELDITDLQEGQAVQDGAIADLGEATSALVDTVSNTEQPTVANNETIDTNTEASVGGK